MFDRKGRLNRRTFLRGMGTLVALPLLECMIPFSARASLTKTQRLIFSYIPMGFVPDNGMNAPNYLVNTTNAVKSDVTIVGGLRGTLRAQGPPGDAHGGAFFPFMSGVAANTVKTQGETWDQMVVDMNRGTKVGSINMTGSYYGYSGYEIIYNSPSFEGPDRPVALYQRPADLFNLLFSGTNTVQVDQRLIDQQKRKRGVLHYVMEDIKTMETRVPAADKIRLEEYLTGINELDKRIAASSVPAVGAVCAKPALVASESYPNTLKNFYDIIYYANLCDLTRVSTLMHAAELSYVYHKQFVPGVQSNAPWHALSHFQTPSYQGSSPDVNITRADFMLATAWHWSQIVALISRMKATMQPTGKSLLDESLVVWGSCLSQSDAHSTQGMCIGLAGNGNGSFKTNQVLALNNNQPLNNLWLTLMQGFGSTATKFGDSTGIIPGILV